MSHYRDDSEVCVGRVDVDVTSVSQVNGEIIFYESFCRIVTGGTEAKCRCIFVKKCTQRHSTVVAKAVIRLEDKLPSRELSHSPMQVNGRPTHMYISFQKGSGMRKGAIC